MTPVGLPPWQHSLQVFINDSKKLEIVTFRPPPVAHYSKKRS
jgi:hypothetical protein